MLSLVFHRPVRPLGRESVILCSPSPSSRPSSTKRCCLLSSLSYPSARVTCLVLIFHKDERADVPICYRPGHSLVPIRLLGRESARSYSSSLLSWPACHSLFTRTREHAMFILFPVTLSTLSLHLQVEVQVQVPARLLHPPSPSEPFSRTRTGIINALSCGSLRL